MNNIKAHIRFWPAFIPLFAVSNIWFVLSEIAVRTGGNSLDGLGAVKTNTPLQDTLFHAAVLLAVFGTPLLVLIGIVLAFLKFKDDRRFLYLIFVPLTPIVLLSMVNNIGM